MGFLAYLTVAVVALASFLYYNGGKEFLFMRNTDTNTPLMDLSTCPRPDFESFRRKAIQTPRITVKNFDECLRFGEAMDHPLICTLEQGGADPEAIQTAIMADDTEYDLVCSDLGDKHYPVKGYSKNGTMHGVVSTPGPCMAGFVYGGKHQALLKSVLPLLSDDFNVETAAKDIAASKDQRLMFGTSFASNFPSNRISSGSHSAIVVSMAYQLVGTKKWILHSQAESTLEYAIKTAWIMLPSCVQTYLEGLNRPFVATTGPGDILFFPLMWQHLVYTEAGPSVMTNIRKVSKFSPKYLLTRYPVRTLVQIVLSRLTQTKASNPREGLEDGYVDWAAKVYENTPADEKENIAAFARYLETM